MIRDTSSPRSSVRLAPRRHRGWTGGGVVALTLALAACGSTVQTTGEDGALSLDGTSAVGGSLGSPVALDASGSVIDPTGSGVAASGNGGVAGSVGGPASASPGASATVPGTSSGNGPAAAAPGAPIRVGYLVVKDVGAAFAALGYSLSTGDGRAQAQAAVDLVNSGGGIGGHKIDPVFYEIDATGDLQAQFVESCSFFFEDNDVSAVVAIYNDDEVRACSEKAGVPMVDPNISVPQATIDNYQNVIKPGHPVTETAARALVDGLVTQGWFKPTSASEVVKIGLLTHDTAAWDSVQDTVAARLAAAGLELTSTFEMPEEGAAQASAAGRSAVLRFRQEGVNRVLALDKNGGALSWFGVNAAAQGYYPRLGLSSLSNPVLQPVVLSPRQLEGAAGIGWSPVFDVDPSAQPATSPRTGACAAAQDAAGEDMDGAGARQGGLLACEGTYLLGDAWRAGQTTLPAFLTGARALGTRYQAVAAFATDFARSRAAASGYRAIAYNGGCECFQYGGSVRSFG